MSARPDDPTCPDRSGRALVALAVACSMGAITLGAIWVARQADEVDTVLTVSDARLATPPSTVAPIVDDPTPTTAPSTTLSTVTPAEPTLADLVGPRFSVIPASVAPRPRPVHVETSSIDLADYTVRDVGLTPDGQLEVPDETEIGWYRYGSTPGRPGTTVLAAHVSWNRTLGPFSDLGSMEPGDTITIALDDGAVRTYVVTERTMYGKLELPRDRIWRTTGDETLALITCGGDFNREIRRYRQNIVVYAVPVA